MMFCCILTINNLISKILARSDASLVTFDEYNFLLLCIIYSLKSVTFRLEIKEGKSKIFT